MKQNKKPTGTLMFLKLALLLFVTISSASAILSVEDGWDETDDSFASTTDGITWSSLGGSALDHTYSIFTGVAPDTTCIANPTDRIAKYLINGETTYNLVRNGVDRFTDPLTSEEVTIQHNGGVPDSSARAYIWINMPSACDGVWGDSLSDYGGICTPDYVYDESLGTTVNEIIDGDNYEITSLKHVDGGYMKCQAPSYSDLTDCIDDSRDDINGGDGFVLYDSCGGDNSASRDTEALCDVETFGETHQLRFLDSDHMSDWQEEFMSRGFPNTTFTVYTYDFCGTSLFDRAVEGTISLTQFQSKQRVCSVDTYDATGYVEGYFPHYGYGDNFQNLSYVYGTQNCGSGYECTDSIISTSDSYNLSIDACMLVILEGSCYDNKLNQDEFMVDYGGTCGTCDNTTPENDYLHEFAYEKRSAGYFDNNQFNSSVECVESEEELNGFALVVVILIVSVGVLVFLTSLGILSFILFFIGASIRFALAFRRKNNQEEEEDE